MERVLPFWILWGMAHVAPFRGSNDGERWRNAVRLKIWYHMVSQNPKNVIVDIS